MSTGQKIIKDFSSTAFGIDPGIQKTIQFSAAKAQMQLHDIHARAIACHCECMGMNAENSMAVCANKSIPYADDAYLQTMQKWGLVNEKGEPTI